MWSRSGNRLHCGIGWVKCNPQSNQAPEDPGQVNRIIHAVLIPSGGLMGIGFDDFYNSAGEDNTAMI